MQVRLVRAPKANSKLKLGEVYGAKSIDTGKYLLFNKENVALSGTPLCSATGISPTSLEIITQGKIPIAHKTGETTTDASPVQPEAVNKKPQKTNSKKKKKQVSGKKKDRELETEADDEVDESASEGSQAAAVADQLACLRLEPSQGQAVATLPTIGLANSLSSPSPSAPSSAPLLATSQPGAQQRMVGAAGVAAVLAALPAGESVVLDFDNTLAFPAELPLAGHGFRLVTSRGQVASQYWVHHSVAVPNSPTSLFAVGPLLGERPVLILSANSDRKAVRSVIQQILGRPFDLLANIRTSDKPSHIRAHARPPAHLFDDLAAVCAAAAREPTVAW